MCVEGAMCDTLQLYYESHTGIFKESKFVCVRDSCVYFVIMTLSDSWGDSEKFV